jgi:hypothetical protein
VFALAVVVAGPMYWMGFIERQWVWLVPGLGVVLLARLLLRRRAALESAAEDAPLDRPVRRGAKAGR